jgi:hypothetical protein
LIPTCSSYLQQGNTPRSQKAGKRTPKTSIHPQDEIQSPHLHHHNTITREERGDTEETEIPGFGQSTDEKTLHLSQQIEKKINIYREEEKQTPMCSSG